MTDSPRPAQTFAESEDALLSRWPETKLEPSLDRIQAFTELLGDPQRAYPVIHLTGTNGKTSTSRMIDTLLRALDIRTGRFTSPHVEKMSERISIDGEPLSDEQFVDAFNDVAPYMGLVDADQALPLSFFEAIVGMAYAKFAEAPVDVAVVEVGMGGSWDATNVADGAVAVITPIALDHTAYLGSTTAAIAREKAGIIKPGAVAVVATQPTDALEVLQERALEVGATLLLEDRDFAVLATTPAVGGQVLSLKGLRGEYDDLFLPLYGAHQAQNAVLALAAVEAFIAPGEVQGAIDDELIRNALAQVTSPGRLEVVRRSPTIVLDAAHNPHGAEASAAALEDSFAFSPLIGVIGVMGDKDAEGVLAAFEPHLEHLVITQNSQPRSMRAERLAEIAIPIFGEDRVTIVPDLASAIDAAAALAEGDSADSLSSGAVLITGSVVTVGEARVLLGGVEMSDQSNDLTALDSVADPERTSSPRRGMCAAVLALEAITLGLTTPVMISVNNVSAGVAVLVGVGLLLLCVLTAGLLRRPWAYGLGWAIQVAAVALGFVVGIMFVLGAIFGLLWGMADLLGRRIERERAAAFAAFDAAR